jgi:DNA-binding LytR/AlgR family response regulator
MRLKCLVVDDEPLSQDVLKRYINDSPMLELVKVCSDAYEATDFLQNNHIQLIFLDINMQKLSGIHFIKSLSHPPLVIFTTAYPEYAIEGFEVDAADYLLKPFSYERFLKAINKAIVKINFTNTNTFADDEFILLKSDKKVFKINFKEIYYLQSLGDYIKVHTNEKPLIVHNTFKNLLEQLPTKDFLRIHKSFVIALSKIQYLEGNQVKIANELIPVGLNYKEDLLKRLSKK